MPDPRTLKINDRVRFISLPEEWSRPGYLVYDESVEFMKVLIARSRPSRISRVDDHGIPWIRAVVTIAGVIEHHDWGITESTGWRLVNHRA